MVQRDGERGRERERRRGRERMAFVSGTQREIEKEIQEGKQRENGACKWYRERWREREIAKV